MKNKLKNLINIKSGLVVSSLIGLPSFVKATGTAPAGNPPVDYNYPNTGFTLEPQDAVNVMNTILGVVWPVFIGLAIIFLIFAGYKFVANKPEEGRKALLWGIVGMGVGILAWSVQGIVSGWLF